ncbi:Metalloenzyme, LuxS/M16 peptidase-like protein [Rhodotorula diobovata]|uniref:Metalloenzyme, LuxS/M16 peptidase-like protein n=1 Tax=Rhodotorula diobovata TaxID=5288 RepID=A0A5C5FUY1_9BASI|nr:Metalloenzyme, LuxS/M16 peptidase-like protein [Rhodotorula diobovata]
MLDVHSDSSNGGSPPTSPIEAHDDHVVPHRVGNFRLLAEHQLDVPPFIKIAKWQSEATGLKVVWANTPGPVSNFWTTVCTEVFTSNGTPHTVEHLTFTASEHYPYSGILDALSNRMLSNGTNAWTAVDNTTYTFQSASEEGMLEIVPVFLDHILFPLITPEVFKTEIYHVDGKGEEGGVVFSEMQAREGSLSDVLDQSLRKILYGKRNAYRSETGGKLDALRKLTVQDIIDYHSAMYEPQNMSVVVTGKAIRPAELLKTLQATIEPALVKAGLARGPRPHGWVRPFVESSTAKNPPLLERDVEQHVEYADSDESVGTIEISWVGPRTHDWVRQAALSTAWGYLAGGHSSPAAKKFVNIPEAYCTGIGSNMDLRDPTIATIMLSNVPAKHLDTLAPRFIDFIKDQCLGPLDMKRMAYLLKQQRLSLLETLETDASSYVQGSALQDILYGAEDGSQFSEVFRDLDVIEKLQTFTEDDWLEVLEDWIVERHSITLVAHPSAKLAQKQAADTKALVAANRARLGAAGLARAASELDAAKKLNDHPAPRKLVESYEVPSLSSIGWLEVDTARSNGVARGRETFSGCLQAKINADKGDVPYFIQFDHFPSSFVEVAALLHGPPTELFPLFLDTFFAMPVMREDGTRLSFEQVSRALDELAIDFGAQTLGEGILVRIQVAKEDYEKAIVWLSDVIYGTQLDDVDRLTSLINSSLQDLPGEKEDAFGLASSPIKDLLVSPGSIYHPTNIVNRAALYPRLHERLQKDPKGIIKDLQAMQKKFLDPRAIRIKVSGDVLSLKTPSSSWLTHFEHVLPFPADQLAYLLQERDLLSELGKNPSRKAVIYTVPSSQSNYLFTYARSPDWQHADHAAISVACACLSATNGLLWNAVRGPGLAYGCWIKADAEDGRLAFIVFKSPDAHSAFLAGQKLVQSIGSGKTRIGESDVAAAKSNLAFSLVSSLDSPSAVADASFCDTVVLGRPANYAALALKRVQAVTAADVERVIKTWAVPLFDSKTSVLGAAATPDKRKELVAAFGALGYEIDDRQF